MRTVQKHTRFALPITLVVGLIWVPPSQANQALSLKERLAPGQLFQVHVQVDLKGKLELPSPKEGDSATQLSIKGNSVIEYEERLLKLDNMGQVERTIRVYRKMNFQRQVGDHLQQSGLRDKVSRVVILRHKQMEVPFSPDGPLNWNEIDLVRTDVFTPALLGLLPAQPVQPGQQWPAGSSVIRELTDFSRIDKGTVTCRFERLTAISGRQLAQISFRGKIRGLGEDGVSQQELEGYLYFDTVSRHLSYLTMRGVHSLLDKDGKVAGQIVGNFILTRKPLQFSANLNDEALRSLPLEPNSENTLLLHDDPDLGIRFLYPRRWRVAGGRGRQLGLDEKGGSGILLTVEPLNRMPTGRQFLQESTTWLKKQRAQITHISSVQLLEKSPKHLEHFSLDVKIGKQEVRMYYFVLRQEKGGVVIAARLNKNDLGNLQREVQLITNSIQIMKKQK